MDPLKQLYETLRKNGAINSELSYEDYCKRREAPIKEVKENNLGAIIKEKKILFEDTLTDPKEKEDFLEAFGVYEE